MARLVLSDASPLIALGRVDGLKWLPALFGSVHVPMEVHREVLVGGFPEEPRIAEALDNAWLVVRPASPTTPPLPDLDEGEAACIRLALAQDGPALLLMDERAGRAVAREHGLAIAGTAAVIGMAKERGLIPSAREVFAQLHGSDFRLGVVVIQTVLKKVGEAE